MRLMFLDLINRADGLGYDLFGRSGQYVLRPRDTTKTTWQQWRLSEINSILDKIENGEVL
jgi:hypothetical protein